MPNLRNGNKEGFEPGLTMWYGARTWTVEIAQEDNLNSAEMRML